MCVFVCVATSVMVGVSHNMHRLLLLLRYHDMWVATLSLLQAFKLFFTKSCLCASLKFAFVGVDWTFVGRCT